VKGKHLVIGLIVFTIIVVGAIYFLMNMEFNKPKSGPEPTEVTELNKIESSYDRLYS